MTAHTETAGRKLGKRKLIGGTLVIATGTLLLATELPKGLSSAVGGSTALAELAARSPGVRVGGVALKAKAPRLASVSVAPASGGPSSGSPIASVLGSAGPEGAIPATGPVGPGGFPSEFLLPAVPGVVGAGGPSASGPSADFGTVAFPSVGGLPIFAPGLGGGSGGGGGGGVPGTGTQPGTGETPGGGTLVPPTTPPPLPGVGGVPEPCTWLVLIVGFGVVGGAMRRRGRVRLA